MICTNCYYWGIGKTVIRGSLAIELVLWLFFFWAFLVPPLVYSIWRRSKKIQVCPQCGQNTLIPEKSPRGEELVAKLAKRKDGAEIEFNSRLHNHSAISSVKNKSFNRISLTVFGALLIGIIFWFLGIASQWIIVSMLFITVTGYWWYRR